MKKIIMGHCSQGKGGISNIILIDKFAEIKRKQQEEVKIAIECTLTETVEPLESFEFDKDKKSKKGKYKKNWE